MNRLLFGLACGLLAGLALLFFMQDGGGSPALTDRGGESSSAREVERPAGGGSEGPVDVSQGVTGSGTDSRMPLEAPRTQAPGAAFAPAEGRLIIRDVNGRELREEDGELVVETPEGERLSLAFLDGRFPLEAVPEGRVRIERATAKTVDGPRPVAFDVDMFQCSPTEPVLLVGRYLMDCTLRVVDAGTELPVDAVRVLPDQGDPERSHPGPHFPAAFIVRDESSPVRMPRDRGVRGYWVTAQDYGWQHIRVDHESGGERVVRLERGGRLMVQVEGNLEAYRGTGLLAEIRVYPRDSERVVASSDLGSFQGFPGVSVGSYDVRAEQGSEGASATVLGATRVEVVAGQTITARIQLDPGEAPVSRGRVAGDVIVPNEHVSLGLRPSLRITPAVGPPLRSGDAVRIVAPGGPPLRYADLLSLEQIAMQGRYGVKGVGERFRWKTELSVGSYLFVVEPVLHGEVLQVPESPEANLRINLPDLVPVSLRVIDSTTRQSVEGAVIQWSRTFPGGDPEARVEMSLAPGSSGTTQHLTQGGFTFSARAQGYADASMEAFAGPGASEFTLELTPCLSREIVLMKGETRLPWREDMDCNFRIVGLDELTPGVFQEGGGMRVCFTRPGLYEATLRLGGVEVVGEVPTLIVEVEEQGQDPIVLRL